MPPSLDDSRGKLRWARHHYEALRSQIDPFEQGDNYRIRFEVKLNEGQYDFYVEDLKPLNDDWSYMIGDCVHNTRSALDYVLVQLVALKTGQHPRTITDVQFPILSDGAKWPEKAAQLKAKKVQTGYLTRLEELQPFRADDPSIWGTLVSPPLLPAALQRLAELDNVDKHRVVHTTWYGGDVVGVGWPDVPPGFEFTGGGGPWPGPLENGAHIGIFGFAPPLPYDWQPDQVYMKRHFPLKVAFADPKAVNSVTDLLAVGLWAVEQVIGLFEPVFSHGAPPLPVTASLASELTVLPGNKRRSDKLRILLPFGAKKP